MLRVKINFINRINSGNVTPVIKIQPQKGWISLRLGELWDYRELIYFLVWRDIKVRYQQTMLGASWAILQPFLTMVVFSVIFGRLARMPSEGLPYPIFAYTALLPWQLFANGVNKATTSLVSNQPLLTKVYFPRLILPLSAVMGGLVDFGCAFVVFLGMMFYYGIFPGAAALLLPLFILFTMTISLSVGLWLSALNVEYRDVGQAISFLIQIWLFATPIVYPSSLVPKPWRTLLGLNPMTGVVEGFRWALLGKGEVTGPLMIVSVLSVSALLFGGLMFFRRMEKTFADYI